MTADPIYRLPVVFGEVLARYRGEKRLTVAEFANAAGYSSQEVVSLECGSNGATLKDFFRLARALGLEPPILLVKVIAEWRPARSTCFTPPDLPTLRDCSDWVTTIGREISESFPPRTTPLQRQLTRQGNSTCGSIAAGWRCSTR